MFATAFLKDVVRITDMAMLLLFIPEQKGLLWTDCVSTRDEHANLSSCFYISMFYILVDIWIVFVFYINENFKNNFVLWVLSLWPHIQWILDVFSPEMVKVHLEYNILLDYLWTVILVNSYNILSDKILVRLNLVWPKFSHLSPKYLVHSTKI